MFWRVAGYSQPSPIEQILDKEEFTLEEILDEDDIIQECKSLNGRLIAFLRERSTVEQLIRYLVEPPKDSEDPRRQYKFPFTACEVFCCDVEAVFNTLLEDAQLMQLLFSLLDHEPPLNCKVAGYFGRVVAHLLVRKTNEMMQYLQDNGVVLESLINHIDTTSIADVLKRLVGADDQSSLLFMPTQTQWLAETALVDLLLQRLGPQYASDVQANAADILSAIAHTQPSPVAAKLTQEYFMQQLFIHALAPTGKVLVQALDVCIALLEPRKASTEPYLTGLSEATAPSVEATTARDIAVDAVLQYVPQLVALLDMEDPSTTQETPYGVLAPPLGTARLKVVELLAVLMRAGSDAAERVIMDSGAVSKCMDLFSRFPFNNLLHHHVTTMLASALSRPNSPIFTHLLEDCNLIDWLISVPREHTPKPRPGQESPPRPPLRSGYLGHVTKIANKVVEVAERSQWLNTYTVNHDSWRAYVNGELQDQTDRENVMKWNCGRPAPTDLSALDSDPEDYGAEAELELENVAPHPGYHRYGAADEQEEEEEEEASDFKDTLGSNEITSAMAAMDLSDGPNTPNSNEMEKQARSLPESHVVDNAEQSMEDDDQVLFASDEELDGDRAGPPVGDAAAASRAAPAKPTAVPAAVPVEDVEEIVIDSAAEDMAMPGESNSEKGDAEAELSPTEEPAEPATQYNDSIYWKPTWQPEVDVEHD